MPNLEKLRWSPCDSQNLANELFLQATQLGPAQLRALRQKLNFNDTDQVNQDKLKKLLRGTLPRIPIKHCLYQRERQIWKNVSDRIPLLQYFKDNPVYSHKSRKS